MNKRLLTLFLSLFVTYSTASYGGEFLIDAGVGAAFASEGEFEPTVVVDVSGGYQFSFLSLKAGVVAFSEFENESNSDFEIEVNGIYLGIAKNVSAKVLEFELGAGLVASQSEATFRGDEFETDDDVSPYFNVMILKPLPGPVSLFGQYKYINDLSGSDIDLYEAGARIKF